MKTLFKNISWFIKREKKSYIKMILILILISFLTTLTPKVIGLSIDSIAFGTLNKAKFIWIAISLILLPLSLYFLNKYYHYNINLKGQILSKELRIKYLTKLFSSDIELYEKYNKGELITRISNDLLSITQAATILVSDLIYCVTLIIFIFLIMIFNISFKLTVVAFLIIPISFLILSLILKRMRKYYFKHRKIFENFFDSILESVEGMRIIRSYVYEEKDEQKNFDAIKKDISSWKYIATFETMFTPFFEAIIAISTFLTFSYGTYLVVTSQLTPGELVTFSIYVTLVSWPLLVLANVYNIANQAIIGSKRFSKVMENKNQVEEKDDSNPIFDFNEIQFKNVSFKYPNDQKYVLKDISFTIKKNQKIGIVGPSGSGKSTLLRHFLRDFNPTKGEILIDGNNIEDYKIKDVLNLVGYVPQINTLFKGSIKENLQIANEESKFEDLHTALEQSAMQEDLLNMEQGVDTYLNEEGRGLSGGQKQRLSIARALIKKPKILILDDSLSAVDTNTEKYLLESLTKNKLDKTIIIVSHRFSVVKDCDIIYVLEDGHFTQKGTHKQLISKEGWYRQEYLNQVGDDSAK